MKTSRSIVAAPRKLYFLDRLGWPVERIKGRYVLNFFRLLIHTHYFTLQTPEYMRTMVKPDPLISAGPTECDSSKRSFLKVGSVGLSSVALTGGLAGLILTQTACAVKNVAFWVSTITGTLDELSPLLPGAAATIAKAVKAANDFLAAYKAGKFIDSSAILKNLVGFLDQIAIDVGITGNPQLKIIFAVAGVAARTIATLLAPQIPASMMAGAPSADRATLDRLTNPSSIDAIFVASKP